MSAVADGVGRAVCALTGAWRGEAAEPPTHSIADGTALHRGRVGSRHFQKPLGFVLGASLFLCPSGDVCLGGPCDLSLILLSFFSRSVSLRENFFWGERFLFIITIGRM